MSAFASNLSWSTFSESHRIAKRTLMAEEAIQFVIEKLLRPIGIETSLSSFNDAATNGPDVLNEMKQAVYGLLAHVLFTNKQEARNWTRKCSLNFATDIMRLMGYDPFLFDLDNSSQHLLITLCWLIWRADLFKTLYDPLLPKDDSYLPPYGILCADDNDVPLHPVRQSPEDPNELTARIQRLVGRMSYQLQMLGDLEVTRETLHCQVRAIDPETSLYALSLKANPMLLSAHAEALRAAVQNSEQLKEIAKVEQTFWRWAFNVVDNLTIDRDRFDATRSLPAEWYPPFTRAPFTRHNRGVDDLHSAIGALTTRLGKCQDLTRSLRLRDLQSDLNRRQSDLIAREIDDLMESLERIEEVKVEEREEAAAKLIPELPFKDYSDSKLQRIIAKSERKSEEIAKRSCPSIAEVVAQICSDLGFQPHGWKCTIKESHFDEEEDGPPRPAPTRISRPSGMSANPPTKQKIVRQDLPIPKKPVTKQSGSQLLKAPARRRRG
jgi:hypothetical protein